MTSSKAKATPAQQAAASMPQHVPPFRLANPGNHCNLNSYLHALWTASRRCHVHNLLPQVHGDMDERLMALYLFGFQLLGWSRPERQHNVPELIDFLNPHLSVLRIVGKVESRRQTSEGVQKQFEGLSAKCIRLIRPPRHKPALQDLVQFWFSQDAMHALTRLTRPDPWLFLQLPRFVQVGSRVSNGKHIYHCTNQRCRSMQMGLRSLGLSAM